MYVASAVRFHSTLFNYDKNIQNIEVVKFFQFFFAKIVWIVPAFI